MLCHCAESGAKLFPTHFGAPHVTEIEDKSGKFVSLGQENEHTQFWAETYDGKYGKVIFGHNPFMQDTPKYFANAIGIDTGCVFGGYLTALIITEQHNFISILAHKTYAQVKN